MTRRRTRGLARSRNAFLIGWSGRSHPTNRQRSLTLPSLGGSAGREEVPDIDLTAARTEAPLDSEQGQALAERLRLAVESIHEEFPWLSKPDAERLIFHAAQEVLSAASVTQFIPTFAERRARQLLTGSPPPSIAPGRPFGLAVKVEPEVRPPDPAPVRPDPPAPFTPGDPASVPPWPGEFYATEAKRLLEKARHLRAETLAESPG